MDPLALGARIAVLVASGLALVLVHRLRGSQAISWRRVRTRLLFGLPLGTLLTAGLLAVVYFFVQGGYGHDHLLTLPFVSWSLRYPLGMVAAPLSHQSLGHLVGNLAGFLVFGTLAEFAVGHYPRTRGQSAFSSLRTNPYARVLGFPAGVVLVALLTSLFAWGPIIGFSGVVFAAVGFALVHYPLVTVAGLIGQEFLTTTFWTLRNPIQTATAGTSYGAPWWANVAVQTHLLGLLLGVGLGLAWQRYRTETVRTDPWRLFVASVLVGSSLTLWALWWYSGVERYRLFRAPGFVLLLGVAVLITVAASLRRSPITDLSAREFSIGLLVVPVLIMGGIALPVNLTATGAVSAPGDTVTVADYEVGYAEAATDPRYEPLNVSFVESPSPPTVSGVIVASEKRHLWTQAVSAGRLANADRATVTVGGLGWRESIEIRRTGWEAVGGDAAVLVRAAPGEEDPTAIHASDAATADAVVAGRTITVAPRNGSFALRVEAEAESAQIGTPDRGPVPEPGEKITIGEIRIEHDNSSLIAGHEDTRVVVFRAAGA
ncbi:rhomboid family intramembrane serine protease [Halodesulfurarchaeum sp. HSR-GB]|uniref:rhomboid family intramembrane serine protease n=1 Tax=Halodesulfurarchaeum sp. HSR-GB TaxID=3074077 RepID=UPI00286188FD|nr:rhomboid family intramembrane serine protease [Halodesulfurarchaeum sp. HSR-GB]MDR5656922.1 rhomboid family intramembrane serine protease [Halodesulfurarchaeum sp. HSR-GB]